VNQLLPLMGQQLAAQLSLVGLPFGVVAQKPERPSEQRNSEHNAAALLSGVVSWRGRTYS
jgi:hypothetical protein